MQFYLIYERILAWAKQPFQINIDYLQLTSGQTKPIFESNTPIVYIKHNWLLHLRDYLIEINAQMKIKNTWQVNLFQYKDKAIMDEVIKCGATKRELKTFNNWRIYFRVNCLSEICNAEGTKISSRYTIFPTKDITHQTSKIPWPQQGKPNKKSFQIWTKLLFLTFDVNRINLLNDPLGPWFPIDKREKLDWMAYYDSTNSMVAIPDPTT
jgi:hypothetical protein